MKLEQGYLEISLLVPQLWKKGLKDLFHLLLWKKNERSWSLICCYGRRKKVLKSLHYINNLLDRLVLKVHHFLNFIAPKSYYPHKFTPQQTDLPNLRPLKYTNHLRSRWMKWETGDDVWWSMVRASTREQCEMGQKTWQLLAISPCAAHSPTVQPL